MSTPKHKPITYAATNTIRLTLVDEEGKEGSYAQIQWSSPGSFRVVVFDRAINKAINYVYTIDSILTQIKLKRFVTLGESWGISVGLPAVDLLDTLENTGILEKWWQETQAEGIWGTKTLTTKPEHRKLTFTKVKLNSLVPETKELTALTQPKDATMNPKEYARAIHCLREALQHNDLDNFNSMLIRLMLKADVVNTTLLAKGYPELMEVVNRYKNEPGFAEANDII